MKPKYGALLSSSQDNQKLSLTIKGILVALVPLAVIGAKALGWDFAEADLMQLVEAGGAMVAAAMTIYGLLRKLKNNTIKP